MIVIDPKLLPAAVGAVADDTPRNQIRDTAVSIVVIVAGSIAARWIYDRYFVKPHRRKLYEKNTLR